jgi:hypothetical protein
MLQGTVPGTSILKGFSVGQENVEHVVTPSQVQTACVGCHASTPDGYIALGVTAQPNDGDPAAVALVSASDPTKQPSYLTASAGALLARPYQYAPAFSKAHGRTAIGS